MNGVRHLTVLSGNQRPIYDEIGAGISVLRQIDPLIVARGLDRLRADLESGTWENEVGRHLPLDALDLGYRLITADLPNSAK